MNNKLPLLEEVLKYHKENNLSLSIPGNKSGIGFLKNDISKEFVNNMGYLDISGVGSLDNLYNPEGVIKEAQELLAQLYKADKAYFLVNGSSSGILASIFSAFNEGDEVLVERNCHKSIYNAIILRKLKPIYIETNIDLNTGVLLPCSEKFIEDALSKSKDPRGIILTSPNYYGISCYLEKTLRKLIVNGLKIVIDAAHGAHYGISKKLPEIMTSLAHYIVMSAHKTLPALTQGAYLLVNDMYSNIEFFLSAFNTSSPSYLIMSSLDYARYYLENYGEEEYNTLIDLAEVYKSQINSFEKVKILSEDDIEVNYKLDKSRYIMILPVGYSGHKLNEYLLKNKIQSEMSFSRGVVLVLSPFNTREDFEKIYQAIMFLDIEELKDDSKDIEYLILDKVKRLEPFEVHNSKLEEVDINHAVGKIAKDFIVPYPLGIPLVPVAHPLIEESLVNVPLAATPLTQLLRQPAADTLVA